jgi:hypothetical protein
MCSIRFFSQAICCSLLATLLCNPAPGGETDLAGKAQAILKTHCYRCHGAEAKAKGGFSYVLNRDQLVARNKLVPGNAEKSELYQRIVQAEMPPKNSPSRPGADDVAILKRWIDTGAPSASAPTPRSFLSEAAVHRLILADLEKIEPRQRRFMRYLTLHHLANAAAPHWPGDGASSSA